MTQRGENQELLQKAWSKAAREAAAAARKGGSSHQGDPRLDEATKAGLKFGGSYKKWKAGTDKDGDSYPGGETRDAQHPTYGKLNVTHYDNGMVALQNEDGGVQATRNSFKEAWKDFRRDHANATRTKERREARPPRTDSRTEEQKKKAFRREYIASGGPARDLD